MILEDAKIRVIDTKLDNMRDICVKEFASLYGCKGNYNLHPANIIDENHNQEEWSITFPENDHILISDLDGWTSILAISKFRLLDPKAKDMYLVDQIIPVCVDEMLVDYDPKDSKNGFHGAALYHFNLNNISSLVGNNINSFTGRIGMYHFENINIDIEEDAYPKYGYIIRTKSGFYNVTGRESFIRFNGGCKESDYK